MDWRLVNEAVSWRVVLAIAVLATVAGALLASERNYGPRRVVALCAAGLALVGAGMVLIRMIAAVVRASRQKE